MCVWLAKDEWKYLRLAGRMRWLYFRCTMKPLAQKPGQGPRLSALRCPLCSCKGNCWRYDRKWQYLWKNQKTKKQTKAWMVRVVSLFIPRRHWYCSILRLLARTQWLLRGFWGYLLWLPDGYHIWSRKNLAKAKIKCVSRDKILHDSWSISRCDPGPRRRPPFWISH